MKIENNADPETIDISNLTIQGGNSNLSGGGFYFEHTSATANVATLNISNFIAQFNKTGTFGSGIAIYDIDTAGLTAIISDCLVENNNISGTLGGPAGIYIDNENSNNANNEGTTEVTISRCRIINNDAALDGGGLFINTGFGNATLVNNVIAGNSVSRENGGGLIIYNAAGGSTTLTNNTITGNENIEAGAPPGSLNGTELYVLFENNLSSLELYNNIFYNTKTGTDLSDDIYIANPNFNSVTVQYNDVNDARFYVQDTTNLTYDVSNFNNADPLFVNPGDFHLTALSPLVDT